MLLDVRFFLIPEAFEFFRRPFHLKRVLIYLNLFHEMVKALFRKRWTERDCNSLK